MKLISTLALLLISAIGSSVALAQTTATAQTTSSTIAPNAETNTTIAPTPTEQKKPSLLSNLILGYKSSNDTGRFGYVNHDMSKDSYDGRQYKGKHEAKLGYKFAPGWGLYGQITQYRNEFKDGSLNKWSVSDPSITLSHPNIYETPQFFVNGSIRYYVPFTDRSKLYNVRQVSYYLDSVYKISAEEEIFNEINPRIFIQDSYAATDTRAKLEDITTYTRRIGSWGRFGLGQWTQIEQHAGTSNGATVDVYPLFDFMISRSVFLGPRLYLPIYVENTVYDGARNTTWENAYFQLYMQANL